MRSRPPSRAHAAGRVWERWGGLHLLLHHRHELALHADAPRSVPVRAILLRATRNPQRPSSRNATAPVHSSRKSTPAPGMMGPRDRSLQCGAHGGAMDGGSWVRGNIAHPFEQCNELSRCHHIVLLFKHIQLFIGGGGTLVLEVHRTQKNKSVTVQRLIQKLFRHARRVRGYRVLGSGHSAETARAQHLTCELQPLRALLLLLRAHSRPPRAPLFRPRSMAKRQFGAQPSLLRAYRCAHVRHGILDLAHAGVALLPGG